MSQVFVVLPPKDGVSSSVHEIKYRYGIIKAWGTLLSLGSLDGDVFDPAFWSEHEYYEDEREAVLVTLDPPNGCVSIIELEQSLMDALRFAGVHLDSVDSLCDGLASVTIDGESGYVYWN